MPDPIEPVQQPAAKEWRSYRLAILVLVALAIAGFAYSYRGLLRLESLAAHETRFRETYAAHPALTLAVALLLYVAVTGLSLPGAAAMSVLYGWLFGFWLGLVLVSFASTAGATLAFLLSRYLFGQWIQARYAERLVAFNEAIDHDGAFYLFTLRLIPQAPFFVINAAMGLTRLPARTFWWVSQLGMLPGTIVFILAGASAPSLNTIAEKGLGSLLDWRLAAPLALLGVLPLIVRWVARAIGWRLPTTSLQPSETPRPRR